MLRSTFVAFSLAIIGTITAQLAPERSELIGRHMLAVNAEWSTMVPSMIDDGQLVSFASDAVRIAEHLRRVADRLGARTPISAEQVNYHRRHMLLDTLQAYAHRGVFPANDALPGRTPVFIDDHGTACAVGYLMIASGHEGLAERIHREMNLAYIHAITIPEVSTWADDHGFTIDELAWIQPTYEFEKLRNPGVLATIDLANGDRVEVRSPNGPNAPQKLRLVRRNAKGEKVLATLPMLSAVQAMEFNGRVYVGGMPPEKGPSAEVYHWDGTALHALDPFPGRMVIGSLFMQNEILHVVGYELGNPEPQERYLTEDGEWKAL
ncbi:MAG: hypothetical protein R2817_10400 [Flavobacteriales bacterium]